MCGVPNRAYIVWSNKWEGSQKERNESTIATGDFNTPPSEIEKFSWLRSSKHIGDSVIPSINGI